MSALPALVAMLVDVLVDGDWHRVDSKSGATTIRETAAVEPDPAGGAPRLVLL